MEDDKSMTGELLIKVEIRSRPGWTPLHGLPHGLKHHRALFDFPELALGASAGPLDGAADVAELGAAPARHVLAGVAVLDVGAAAVAAPPALFLGQLLGPQHVHVPGAGPALVVRPAAHGAGPVASGAFGHAGGPIYLAGAKPETASRMTAVDAITDWDAPFLRPFAVRFPQRRIDVPENSFLGDGIEAALGGPLCFVLASRRDEATEAVVAIAVAWSLDKLFCREFIET